MFFFYSTSVELQYFCLLWLTKSILNLHMKAMQHNSNALKGAKRLVNFLGQLNS